MNAQPLLRPVASKIHFRHFACEARRTSSFRSAHGAPSPVLPFPGALRVLAGSVFTAGPAFSSRAFVGVEGFPATSTGDENDAKLALVFPCEHPPYLIDRRRRTPPRFKNTARSGKIALYTVAPTLGLTAGKDRQRNSAWSPTVAAMVQA